MLSLAAQRSLNPGQRATTHRRIGASARRHDESNTGQIMNTALLAGASALAIMLLMGHPAAADDRSNQLDGEQNGGSGDLVESSDLGTDSAVLGSANETTGTDLGDGIFNALVSIAVSIGLTDDIESDEAGTHSNAVTDSFNGFSGTPVVQQNTGDFSAVVGVSERATALTNVGGVMIDIENEAAVDGDGATVSDDATTRRNLINPSFNDADGTALVQQNNGNASALSAVDVTADIVGDTGPIDQSASAVSSVDDINTTSGAVERDNTVDNSFAGYSGEVKLQQNNGDGSALTATQSTVTLGGIAEAINQSATASSSVSNSTAVDAGSTRENTLNGAFNSANAVISVQQNNGNGSALSAAATVVAPRVDTGNGPPGGGEDPGNEESDQESNQETASLGTPHNLLQVIDEEGGETPGPASSEPSGTDQPARVSGTSQNNTADASGGERRNAITDSFNGGGSVVTIQQNNGDNAAVGSATSVVVDTEDNDFGQAASSAALQSSVSGNSTSYAGTPSGSGNYSNSIAGSFNQSRNISVTAQQNNGANSVMGSAISIRIGN